MLKQPGRNPTKAKRAAADPKRPGELCKAEPGAWIPEVDRGKCEGKGDCIEVCPYDVFELATIKDEDFAALGMLGRFKSRVHGRKTVYLAKPDACQACGLCVVACPENALALVRTLRT